MITHEELLFNLKYDTETGVFYRKTTSKYNKTVHVGSVAGHINKQGYNIIKINSKAYKSHRLAWLYVYCEMPPIDIDHINGIKSDNRILNLRLSTESENLMNIGKMSTNTSGYKGVHYHKRDEVWAAKCTINGKQNHLGNFATVKEASVAYRNFAILNHGEFYRDVDD